MSETQRKRILVVAFACNPRKGSEHAVGWDWVNMIAKKHDVFVITANFEKQDIENTATPNRRIVFTYVSHRFWHYHPNRIWQFIELSPFKPIMNFSYLLWQIDANKKALELNLEHNFDIVHQLTYVGFRFPGFLWKLKKPFVWGPLGGLENIPWRLLPSIGIKGMLFYGVRNIINSAQISYSSSIKKALDTAGPGIIAATQGIQDLIQHHYGKESTIISEVTIPARHKALQSKNREIGNPLRIIWTGTHTAGKALNLLLNALSGIPKKCNVELHVIGDGPENRKWKRLAEKLGLRNIIWHGLVSRSQALGIMANGHLLAITSLKDLTSNVAVEGIFMGLPVIAPNHCGFPDVVTKNSGILISYKSKKSLIQGLSAAIIKIETNENLRRRLSRGAICASFKFSSERKMETLDIVYNNVVDFGREEKNNETTSQTN